MSAIERTESGDVIFLARAPGQVAEQPASSGASVNRGATSGNSNFDPVTGKFAKKGGADPKGPAGVDVNPVAVNRSGIPQGVDPATWNRRIDIVRVAARQFTDMSPEDVTAFLQNRVADVSQVNVDQFLVDVKAHQMDDLVDIMDTKLRGVVQNTLNKSPVKISSSKNWTKSVFGGLTDDQVTELVSRLSNRGWSTDVLKKNVLSSISDKTRRAAIATKIGTPPVPKKPAKSVKLDDELETMFDYDAKDKHVADAVDRSIMKLADAVQNFELPAPIVNVPAPVVQVTVEQKPTRKTIKRGDDGFLSEVIEEPIDD